MDCFCLVSTGVLYNYSYLLSQIKNVAWRDDFPLFTTMDTPYIHIPDTSPGWTRVLDAFLNRYSYSGCNNISFIYKTKEIDLKTYLRGINSKVGFFIWFSGKFGWLVGFWLKFSRKTWLVKISYLGENHERYSIR